MVLRDQNTFPGMFTQEERYVQAEGSGSWRVTCKVPQPTRSSEGDNDNQRYTLVTETATESTKPLSPELCHSWPGLCSTWSWMGAELRPHRGLRQH